MSRIVSSGEIRRELAARLAGSGQSSMQPRDDAGLMDLIEPGRIVGLMGGIGFGLTKLGMSLLVEQARLTPVAVVDHRGWFSPLAAWEVGIDPDSLYVVRADRAQWPQVVAALMSGIRALYADVPPGTGEQELRRLAAIARRERSGVVLRSEHPIPSGIAHWNIRVEDLNWDGPQRGHGRLRNRTLRLTVTVKGVAGIERRWEVSDDGTNPVRLVAGLAASSPRRAIG